MYNPSFHPRVQGASASGEWQRTVRAKSHIKNTAQLGDNILLLNQDVLTALGSQNEPTCHQRLHWLQQNSSQCQTKRHESSSCFLLPIFPHHFPVYCLFLPFSPSPFTFFQELGLASWDCFVAHQRACDHESCSSRVLNCLICEDLSHLITKGKTRCWELEIYQTATFVC